MNLPFSRRRFLAGAAVGAATGVVGTASRSVAAAVDTNESDAIAALPDAVGIETVVDGLAFPLAVAFAPDADRRYVAERDGRIWVHESDGLRDEPLLDLRETVITGGERGLLGMAIHPDFAENRRLFVHYSAPRRSDTPREFDHTGILATFEATDDGTGVRSDSERVVLEIPQPADFHNGGDLAFGPDDYLYAGIGAGGGGGGGGQDVTTDLLGSVIRIDVDGRSAAGEYAVPDDNPLVGRDGLDEYYAWGFRNPWRLSFDDGDCFVADVGESDYEEVNLLEKGGNYGWNVKEGSHCFREEDCPDETATDVRGGERFRDPIIEYPHPPAETDVSGVSVIGGYVSRDSELPALEGAYVFGDLVADGRLFAATRPDGDDELWPTTAIEIDSKGTLERLFSFGRDDDGAVYALGTATDTGGLFRIVPAT
ncbi:PQQ-dependent sugar dehydrogenase [Haloarchaeobius amylolyticus]|uniref:PQQ-dependent sugar dehydrogenase n=1 Tax=Haloarchaeobius amylolyticus TaxID=1198296 RepID=A0ABD6BBQ7_9EURY